MGVSDLALCSCNGPPGVFFSVTLQVNQAKTIIFASMNKVNRIVIILAIALGAVFTSHDAYAQCPMCKMSAESNLKNGGTTGRGLNAGILYMLALPYTLLGTFGYIWWKNNRKKEEDEVEVLP
jgi:hypothetical protein